TEGGIGNSGSSGVPRRFHLLLIEQMKLFRPTQTRRKVCRRMHLQRRFKFLIVNEGSFGVTGFSRSSVRQSQRRQATRSSSINLVHVDLEPLRLGFFRCDFGFASRSLLKLFAFFFQSSQACLLFCGPCFFVGPPRILYRPAACFFFGLLPYYFGGVQLHFLLTSRCLLGGLAVSFFFSLAQRFGRTEASLL